MLAEIRNYTLQNPNALQIVSTVVILTVAYIVWSFISKSSPPK
ncbi:MAG TPA: hypothetical protein VFG05_06510 [Methylocella sp.]|nr:hypothetical protein [Methylocella sp.]